MDTKQPEALRLAPCPFCGGGARRTTVGTNAWFGTGCDGDQSCPAHLRALTHKTQAEADAAWNRRAPAPASSEPVAVHTDPEGYQDGAWYWVKINGFGGNSIMAPAMYRANCGAWYSHEFIGISTRFLDVLGPCTLASDIYTAAQVQASEPVVLPEPDAVLRFERSTAGKENEMPIVVSCNWLPDGEYKLYTEQQVRAMLATGGQAQAVPNGWREQFATEVYADLEAADNQDVPLEEYPARILKVLDSTVGPRHPVVIKWRNDAIEQCIAIARKYCRDPESHKYLKQDLEAMLTAEPAPQAQAAARDALRMWLDIHDTPAGFAGKYGKALDAAIAAQQLRVEAAASAARAAIAKSTGRFGMTTQHTPMEGRATGLLQAVRSIAAITTCADQDHEAMCAEIQGICRVALAKVTGGAA